MIRGIQAMALVAAHHHSLQRFWNVIAGHPSFQGPFLERFPRGNLTVPAVPPILHQAWIIRRMTVQTFLGFLAHGRRGRARGSDRPAPACGEDKYSGDDSFHISMADSFACEERNERLPKSATPVKPAFKLRWK